MIRPFSPLESAAWGGFLSAYARLDRAIDADLLAPPPQVFGGESGPSPAVVPGLQMLVDIVAIWLLTRRNVMRYYLGDRTSPATVS